MKKKRWLRLLEYGVAVFMIFQAVNVHAERLSVSSATANIRSGPGTEHAVVWQVEKYHPVQILKASGSWYQFKDFENDIGWIHKSLVKKMSTVITKKDKCNIREGPGTTNDVILTVNKGIPFKVEKRQKLWIQIKHADGDVGWIHESLVW